MNQALFPKSTIKKPQLPQPLGCVLKVMNI